MSYHEPSIGESDELKRIRSLLDYNKDTGIFRWRINIGNVKSGTVTGSRTKKGYLIIRVDNRAYLAHRLVWFWVTGRWPILQVDHKNTKKDDNRWENLRLATNAENHLNRGKNSNNTTGYKGVSKHKKSGKYEAYLTVNGKRRYLGRHETAEAAHSAYSMEINITAKEFGRSM